MQSKLLFMLISAVCIIYLFNYVNIYHLVSTANYFFLETGNVEDAPTINSHRHSETARSIKNSASMATAKFRQLNVSEFPYKCGIVLFYHIACTGGASIQRWFSRRITPTTGIEYFTHWGRNQTARKGFARKMNEQLQKPLGPTEWRLSHAHGCSLLPIQDESNLYQWREAIEKQGCKFILTTVVRDPLSHAISQLKSKQWAEMKAAKRGDKDIHIPMEEWFAYFGVKNRTAPRLWASQLDYFLFNCWDKNLDLHNTMSRKEKVKRGIEILRNHFDLVIYQNHDLFEEIITRMIEFPPISLRSSNQHMLEINFTTQELSLMKRKVYENGDVDWIKAIQHIYGDYLKYLVYQ